MKKPRWLAQRATARTLVTLERAHLLDLVLRARKSIPRRSLVVLNYHRVLDDEPDLDEGVISATPSEFDEQMRILSGAAQSLSVDDLCRVLGGEMQMPDNAVMVTFDDGYNDNYRVVLPSLRRHGVRATFFITTGYIETGRLPWWDRVSYIVKHSPAAQIQLRYPTQLSLSLRTERDRVQARRTLLRLLKQVFALDHARFFSDLERAAQLPIDEAALAKGLFMTWSQIKTLHEAGMDIGAHTHSHRVLQTLDAEEAAQELTLPQKLLKERVGIVPRAIAYPVGFPLSTMSGLRELVQQAGYEVGFTFLPGVIAASATGEPPDRFNLPRLSVDRTDRSAAARFKMALLSPTSLL